MKVYMTHKDPEFSAYFTSTITKDEGDYGNGIYMEIRRNDEWFKYIDCRYIRDFNEEKILKQVLQNHFGSNLVAIDMVER